MQSRDAIGKDWANKVLSQGYQSDNKNPSVTTARVWDKKTNKFKTITIKPGDNPMNKMHWRGDMLK